MEFLHNLSDRGTAFLSKLLAEVYQLIGMKKLNTTAYHPQTNRLVERFNRTLLDMLAKSAKQTGTAVCRLSYLHTVRAHSPKPENHHSTCCMGGTPGRPQKLPCGHHKVLLSCWTLMTMSRN